MEAERWMGNNKQPARPGIAEAQPNLLRNERGLGQHDGHDFTTVPESRPPV